VLAEAAREQFLHEVIRPAVRPQALQLIQRHRDQGCQVMIVTATNEFVTRPIAQLLGIEDLIAVELERDAQGWITGEIAGVPSMREGKVQRLQQWLVARGWDWTDVDTTFYSDSTNDLPLLGRVNHPVATNPDDRLREQALQRGWPILELFTAS
jgi:HAD superfamily hydrolase (TIGR01490 family)